MIIRYLRLPRLHWNAQFIPLLLAFPLLLLIGRYVGRAELTLQAVAEVRTLYPSEWGVDHPAGLAYSVNLNQFFLVEKNDTTQPTIVALTPYEELLYRVNLDIVMEDTINLTFDDTANRLLLLNQTLTELIQLQLGSNGRLDPATATAVSIAHLGLTSARGMAIDAKGKFLFILDGAASQIVRVKLKANLDQLQFTKFELAPTLDLLEGRGIALNPKNRNLYIIHPRKQILYELTQSAQSLAHYDLTGLQLTAPHAATYAPSPDLTDDATNVHLFIADSQVRAGQSTTLQKREPSLLHQLYLSFIATGADRSSSNESVEPMHTEPPAMFGKIVEVALGVAAAEVSAASPNLTPLTLVQTINMAAFSPPSPDPSGITYLPATGILLVSDAEVEEMAIYQGVNVFGIAQPNVLAYTRSTIAFSNEPAGVAYNPNNGHIFYSNDQAKRVNEVNPGPDGIDGTGDDVITTFSTSAFNDMDPEGIDYDPASGALFIVDGINNEVYRLDAGANGIFDGVPASGGDDTVTHFDTAVSGILDPESVDFDPATGNLILISAANPARMYEVTTAGSLVQTFDISAAGGKKIGGVAIAPGSTNPSIMNYYIVDRGVDNNADPNENDGKIYEFTSGANPPTATPTATPTPTNTSNSTPTATPTLVSQGDTILVSSTSNGKIGALSFADEDILAYNSSTVSWSFYFDGSDVGLSALDVDALALLNDGSLLLSFDVAGNIGTLGLVDDSDIVRFMPSSIGPVTAGTFAWYFRGADVELTVDSEDIDAFAVLNDGRLLLSTIGTLRVTGLPSLADEDLALFTPTQLGATTSGAWSLYFDGSDVGLSESSTEDVNGGWIDPINSDIYLTTTGAFDVTGVSGDGADIFICTPGSTGANTSCTFRMYWDGSANGFAGEVIDAFEVDPGAQLLSRATLTALQTVPHDNVGDDLTADPDEQPDDVDEGDLGQQFFLPLLIR